MVRDGDRCESWVVGRRQDGVRAGDGTGSTRRVCVSRPLDSSYAFCVIWDSHGRSHSGRDGGLDVGGAELHGRGHGVLIGPQAVVRIADQHAPGFDGRRMIDGRPWRSIVLRPRQCRVQQRQQQECTRSSLEKHHETMGLRWDLLLRSSTDAVDRGWDTVDCQL